MTDKGKKKPTKDGLIEVCAYTDGACRGNPGPGGWGVLLECHGRQKEIYGGEPGTTNNRMELMAAIQALEAITKPCQVRLVSDSQYVVKGMKEWLPGWKRRGWKASGGGPVKNEDLWRRLDAAAARHRVEWLWVKGHSGNPGNERADALANKGVPKPQSAGIGMAANVFGGNRQPETTASGGIPWRA